ncbi:MAG: SEL1-like repeat protein [Candidatus Sedimenticola sp. 20ELBAFRAG]
MFCLLAMSFLVSCKQMPVVRDVVSVHEMHQSAEAGERESQYRLGMLYMSGKGVIQNYTTAAGWFEKAAEAGHVDAQFMWASALYSGVGAEQDHPKAVQWFLKSAKVGHKRSQYQLGDAYLNARGVVKDRAWAARWYGMSASQGHRDAQFSLGVLFARGIGLPINHMEAASWFKLAEMGGHEQASELLAKLQQKLSPASYRSALVRAERWKPAAKMKGYWNRPTVRYMQYALGRLGYSTGYADGIRGPKTDQAMGQFLNVRGLKADAGIVKAVALLRKESPKFK